MQSDENVGKVFVDNWSCFHKCITDKQQKECCCDEHKRGKETKVVVSTPEVSEEGQNCGLLINQNVKGKLEYSKCQ